uniref:Transposon protein, putative, CACTA, En/Spm sub-class n=1 Tax=Oryza sativa subsp. japonica TaxID=39947 RepID=Q2QQF4_ORYSJ|nr:transposon protein, putative, CACTA, En/Spm sub-class [Oryza sativa Japonica Group]
MALYLLDEWYWIIADVCISDSVLFNQKVTTPPVITQIKCMCSASSRSGCTSARQYVCMLIDWQDLDKKNLLRCQPEMDRQWMYADRRSKEFIDGVHYFLRVAKANRQRGFICCPCNKCKNQKEYSASRTIHFHLFESGFMPSYNCWTSHGEQGVEMEEDEVEDDNIPDFAQYVGFEGNQTGEEERDADGNDVADDLDQMLQDAKEDCESEKGAHKLDKMLEDHRTLLYPGCEQGHKKLDTTLEFLQ